MFQVQLAQSPMFGQYSNIVSYLTIASESIVVLMLLFKRFRLTGLYASLGLMTAFTAYIYVIINYSDSIPCSCGGVLENMDWNTHLIFNLVCVAASIIGIYGASTFNKNKLPVFIAGVMALPALFIFSMFYPHIDDSKGLFKRNLISPLTQEQKTILLPAHSYYFAGHHGDSIFLGHHKTPLLLSTIVPDFKSVKVDTIRLNNYKYDFISVTINVLYPYFSVSDGKVPVVFEGKLPSLTAYDTGIDRLYFSRLYMLAPHQYVFKTMLVKTKESELGILNTSSKEYLINPDVLQTKSNSVFDTDGNIVIDHEQKHIFYLPLYRSQIISTDFKLENIQRKNTLDSLSHIELETKTLENGQTKLLKSPPEINRAQTVANGKFYNVSRMRGKNESYRDFRKNDIIDVYGASSMRYLHSFYLKNDEKVKIRSILSTKHYLYVLAGNKITRYKYK
ncbi:hypothetical protein NAL32_12830 [Chryseobacterium sp. Ch-15]|uniref:Methylamine utilisation protein MauE domain-containing protein n=2 Tax=Chryseobacterium muglaense TaxID=2893752 RepID=A0A9Q3V0G5_9FLAO|nr:MauE/DoxX family redox-associated membrane protein [Chryseobacterium muglaense]MBD3905404.1 hypothetical protein [Chryseobacterium muglaense]MCC9036871.1 hypothetical protein [Chryseobacterium muglaense]MCM2555267.1 hypothetical protein [Chryseobacterium muglaense]